MNVVPFKAEHLHRIELQNGQKYLSSWITEDLSAALEGEHSFSAVEGGDVLACSGVVPLWSGRAAAWAYLAGDLRQRFLGVHRAVARFLDICEFRRVEATVDVGFDEGHRWLLALGFQLETPKPMAGYRPDGGDCFLYARVRQ